MTGKIRPVRRILAVMVAFLVSCGASFGVSAAGALPDLSATGSVLVTPQTSDGLKASDGTLTLYKVADVVWNDGNMAYVKTEAFEAFDEDLDINNTELATLLTVWARVNSVRGTSYKIPSDGSVRMEGLSMGLYLVVQTEASTGFSEMNPFLIGLPLEAGEGWEYYVDAFPKMENIREIVETPDTEPASTSETVDVTGYKTWEDDEDAYNARPDSIMIELYADGIWIITKEVTEADGWMWSWTGLEKYVNGTEIVYTVLEQDVSGYTASYDGYSITNTYVKQTEPNTEESADGSGSVRTADTTNVDLWMHVLLVSVFFLASLLVYRVYRRKSGRRA